VWFTSTVYRGRGRPIPTEDGIKATALLDLVMLCRAVPNDVCNQPLHQPNQLNQLYPLNQLNQIRREARVAILRKGSVHRDALDAENHKSLTDVVPILSKHLNCGREIAELIVRYMYTTPVEKWRRVVDAAKVCAEPKASTDGKGVKRPRTPSNNAIL
jgi:hypothetical protein